MEIKILDCTIRDGGYLNNWDFDLTFVRELYRAHSKSGVDYMEIGFRSNFKYFDPKKLGPWRFTPESLVDQATEGISGPRIAMMVDYGKFDLDDICNKAKSKICLYRVTAHKDKVHQAIEMCEEIYQKGYMVSIQLMGIVNYSDEDFVPVVRALKTSNIEYVYFADSYGSLFPSDVRPIIDKLNQTGKKIGFHAHNNLQLAFATTIEAISYGVDMVDATAYGMGRGAGNLPIEILLSYLEKTSYRKSYNTLPVLDIVDRYLIDLHKRLNWGYDLSYMMSGMMEIHSNYSKKMVDYRAYSIEDILRTLETVKQMNPIGFDKDILEKIIQSGFVGSIKNDNECFPSDLECLHAVSIAGNNIQYQNRFAGRDILVLANGPTLKREKEKIDSFITKYNPVVIGSNFLDGMYAPDIHTFSNKKRFIKYVDSVDAQSDVMVSSQFSDKFIKQYTNRPYETIAHLPYLAADFGIHEGIILSNCRTVSLLSTALAIVMGARRIFIAGMDGYKHIDSFLKKSVHFYDEPDETQDFQMQMDKHNLNEKVLKQIDQYLISKGKDGILILTPTSHKAYYNSIEKFI